MRKTYSIAENHITVTLPHDLAAWTVLAPRYAPFEVPEEVSVGDSEVSDVSEGAAVSASEPVVEVTVTSQALTPCTAEEIYQPDHFGIGFIASRVCRLPDGRILLEFRHVDHSEPRLQMTLSEQMHKATIALSPIYASTDAYFLTHALMLAYMLGVCGNGVLLFHSSAIVLDGRAYLFQGRSGTGKSTHSRMWLENIQGAQLLNDDNPVVSIAPDGTAIAYGSPWSGKTHCYRNVGVPIGGFVRIVRASENRLVALPPLRAYASLTASVFSVPFLDAGLRNARHSSIERLVTHTPCYEMHCLPNADAAHVCVRSLQGS